MSADGTSTICHESQLMSAHAAMRRCDRRYLWASLRKVCPGLDRNVQRCSSSATQHDNRAEDSTSAASDFSPLKSGSAKVKNAVKMVRLRRVVPMERSC